MAIGDVGRMTRIETRRERFGRGSRFEVWMNGELWCHTCDDEDGFKLMIAVNRVQVRWIFGGGTRSALRNERAREET